jgi:uncharacterized protein YxjI
VSVFRPPDEIAAQTRKNTEIARTPIRYRMLKRISSLAEDFYVQNDQGQRAFVIQGKKHRSGGLLAVRDLIGNELFSIEQRSNVSRDLMYIDGPVGDRAAMVLRTMITPLRDQFVVRIGNENEHFVTGNIAGYEYQIGDVAKVSRRWFHSRDSYGVEVAPGHDPALALAATICIDQLTSEVA